MTRSRAALCGPFNKEPLPFEQPLPLDEARRLARWANGARLEACQIELLSGLHFPKAASSTACSFSLTYSNLEDSSPRRQLLVEMTRPTDAIFKAQLGLVATYADLREDRGAEILAQAPGTIDFWASIIGLQAHRHKWTLELLDLAFGMAVHVHMRFKHAFACPRAAELSPQIQTMIPTPGHASWPSGHATESYLFATLLEALLDDAQPGIGKQYNEQLQRLAARIAVNRTVAGLHYPVDSAAGRLLGTALAQFFVARCIKQEVNARAFDGTRFHGPKIEGKDEFRPLDFDPRVSMANGHGYYRELPPLTNVTPAPLLAFIWEKARDEWKLK